MTKRIGIFAGAFDPIHDGHVEVALMALEHLGLEQLVFMVETQPWGIKSPVDVLYRKEMVTLATQQNARMKVFDNTDERFTISDTLPKLEKQFPDSELYFVFGADVFMKMNDTQWPNLKELLKHYVVIFERRDFTEAEISKHAQELGIAIAILPSPHPHHTSSNVRENIHEKHLWVQKEVAEYIDSKKLYSA